MTKNRKMVCRKCGANMPPIPGYELAKWRHCPCGHVATVPFSATTSGQYPGKRAKVQP